MSSTVISMMLNQTRLLRNLVFRDGCFSVFFSLNIYCIAFYLLGFLFDFVIPKKVELSIRFFEPFWISRVFHFSLRTFGEVEHLPDPLGASDETYTQSKFDISGSNETMQNALAPLV